MEKSSWKIILCLALIALTGCKEAANESSTKILAGNNIVGTNDRRNITTTDSTNNSFVKRVGKLIRPDGSHCTATLVGKDLILTAAHCILSGGTLASGDFTFQLYLNNNFYLDTSNITWAEWGTNDPENIHSKDWALVRLAKPLGKTYGYMGVRSIKSSDTLSVAGYGDINADRNSLYIQDGGCSLQGEFSDGLFYHDCDTGHGDSGGPIIAFDNGKAVIVGIVVAQIQGSYDGTVQTDKYTEDYANLGVDADNFVSEIIRLKTEAK